MGALLYNTLLLASPAAYGCILPVPILPLLQLLLRHGVADCTMLLLLPVTSVACLCCLMLLHVAATPGRLLSAMPCFLMLLLHVADDAAAVASCCSCIVTCRALSQSAAATACYYMLQLLLHCMLALHLATTRYCLLLTHVAVGCTGLLQLFVAGADPDGERCKVLLVSYGMLQHTL